MSHPEQSDVVPVPSSELTEGDLPEGELAGYRVLRRLGRGAMAEVFLAEQVSLRRHVALKVLKSNLASQESYVKRFRLEAQAAASLVHPNIIQIYEVGCSEGRHFIAQEYVQGVNLQELLARRGPPPLRLALVIMRQVAAALVKAGERGIIHRDIKPENIMISGNGEVKVADFGLARLSSEETRLTQEGYTLGTPLYMSPEQVEGKPLDVRSDLYSFGVTSYHMLVGNPPYRGESALQVALQHVKGNAEPLEQLRPDLPPAFCRLVHKLFAVRQEDRFANAQEVLKELRVVAISSGVDLDDDTQPSLFEGFSVSPSAPTSRQAVTRELQTLMAQSAAVPGVRRRWAVWTAVAAIVAFSVGLAAARYTRPPSLLEQHNAAPADSKLAEQPQPSP